MTTKSDLKWKDLISPTMSPDDYLEKYGEKTGNNYNSYEPKSDTLDKILSILKEKNEKLKIVALGADWCPDCNINIPRMIKIIKKMNSKEVDFQILYGIIVNALHKPEESIWHKKRSPPEAVEPKFNLKKIPTFYFFNAKGDFMGQIVENPKDSSTLEEDLLTILETNL